MPTCPPLYLVKWVRGMGLPHAMPAEKLSERTIHASPGRPTMSTFMANGVGISHSLPAEHGLEQVFGFVDKL